MKNSFYKHERVFALSVSLLAISTAMFSGACAAQGPATPAFKDVDSVEARVQGCVTCHGQNGEGTGNGYFPRIAGKPEGYLYNQLTAFRDGTRHYPPMNYLVAYLPDDYLREIAAYFAKQHPPFAAKEAGTTDPQILAAGQTLVLQGNPGKGVPACVACHGSALTGMEPGIPGLVGLRPTYIVAQLTRWRVGERHAQEPDCMKRVAERLSDAEITAAAAWLSQQPAPRDMVPMSSSQVRMPFTCGSQKR